MSQKRDMGHPPLWWQNEMWATRLRSTVAGHYSYRRVAWEMFKAVEKRHPSLAQYFRISDVNEPVDLLKR